MQLNASRSLNVFSTLKNKVNLFYFLSFIPLFLILYYDLWIFAIAVYGFFFLLLKGQKLHSFKDPRLLQRILGLILIVSSFFVRYAMILVISTSSYYGIQNYVIFLFGLFLVFFDTSALREAFTPLFFMAAATSSSLVADRLKPYFSPYLGNVASLIVSILNAFGVHTTVSRLDSAPAITLQSMSGSYVYATLVYECLGIFSALVFSIILVVILFEDPSSWKVRLAASIIGITGTFALNIARITIILMTDYFYGAEAGAYVHYVIGYALFSVWLILFLYVYSKRKTIQMQISALFNKGQKH